jgi:hypothetical protein
MLAIFFHKHVFVKTLFWQQGAIDPRVETKIFVYAILRNWRAKIDEYEENFR